LFGHLLGTVDALREGGSSHGRGIVRHTSRTDVILFAAFSIPSISIGFIPAASAALQIAPPEPHLVSRSPAGRL
jgi:hypothetical protein